MNFFIFSLSGSRLSISMTKFCLLFKVTSNICRESIEENEVKFFDKDLAEVLLSVITLIRLSWCMSYMGDESSGVDRL